METEGFYMAEKRWRTWETVGLLVVLAAGNLLHFIYDWTGQSPIAAPLAAVNESTWEHMKLFITPWVLWSLVERIALQGHGSLLPARGLGMLTGLTAIPALFYTYQGILGRGIMWVDVLIFQLAVLLAFWVSWSVQARRVLDGPVWQILGGVTLLAVWGLAICGPTHRPSCRCSWIPLTEAGVSHCGRSAGGGDGLQNVISGQGQARRRVCLPLPICRIRLPVGEHRPGFGGRRGDDPVGRPDIGIFS